MPPSPVFSPFELTLSRLAQGLAHPARVALLLLLSDGQRKLAGQLCAELPLPRTTVSEHLRTLRHLGLVEAEQQGVLVWYSLQAEALGGMRTQLQGFFKEIGV